MHRLASSLDFIFTLDDEGVVWGGGYLNLNDESTGDSDLELSYEYTDVNSDAIPTNGLLYKYPTKIDIPEKVIAVYGTSLHFIFLVENGMIWCLGHNDLGQLGFDHDIDYCIKPTKNPFINNVTQLTCGYKHTLFITDNVVMGFGDNAFGQLGIGCEEPHSNEPCIVKIVNDIKSIVAYGDSSAFITNTGNLYFTGCNDIKVPDSKLNSIYTPILIDNIPKVRMLILGEEYIAFESVIGDILFLYGGSNIKLKKYSKQFSKLNKPNDVFIQSMHSGISCFVLVDDNESVWIMGMDPMGNHYPQKSSDNFSFTNISFPTQVLDVWVTSGTIVYHTRHGIYHYGTQFYAAEAYDYDKILPDNFYYVKDEYSSIIGSITPTNVKSARK